MIIGVVVFFNPDLKTIKRNIQSYYQYIDNLLIIDNSPNKCPFIFNDFPKITYIFNNKNIGIACALKTACDIAISKKADFLLTMDQDSYFEYGAKLYFDFLNKEDMKKIGQICPSYTKTIKDNKERSFVITSGSIINLKAYSETSGFNPDLFIDFVDFDLCYKLKSAGYKIMQIGNVKLSHSLGENRKRKFLWKEILVPNHSPLRFYYMYRNFWYCYHLNKKSKSFFRPLKKDYYFVNFIKLFFYEDKKIEKLRYINLGIKDAKKKTLGDFYSLHGQEIKKK